MKLFSTLQTRVDDSNWSPRSHMWSVQKSTSLPCWTNGKTSGVQQKETEREEKEKREETKGRGEEEKEKKILRTILEGWGLCYRGGWGCILRGYYSPVNT